MLRPLPPCGPGSVFAAWSFSQSSSFSTPLPASPSTRFIPEVGKGVLIKSEEYFCRSSARFAPLLHCLPAHSCKYRSSPASLESRSFVAAGQEPEADAQHEAGSFAWQHTRICPSVLPLPRATWPSHETLQHHSQGRSWPLVTQETAGKCRSWWPREGREQ